MAFSKSSPPDRCARRVMLLYVLDALVGTGRDQRSEVATICSACSVRLLACEPTTREFACSPHPTSPSGHVRCWRFRWLPVSRLLRSRDAQADAAAGSASVQRNLAPSSDMRSRITANLRATATRARLMPAPAWRSACPRPSGRRTRYAGSAGCCRLVERGPRHVVAAFADPALIVRLAEAEGARRQAEMGADVL